MTEAPAVPDQPSPVSERQLSTVSAASKSDGRWKLTFEPDTLHLERIDQPGQRISVARAAFFRELEYREWLGALIIPRLKRLVLRLREDDQNRLRSWLGQPGAEEIAYVLRLRLKGQLASNLVVLATFLLYGAQTGVVVLCAVSLVHAVAAWLRPRLWLLAAEGLIWFSWLTIYGSRLWDGQSHSKLVEVLLIVTSYAFTLTSLRAWWRLWAADILAEQLSRST